MLGTEILLLAKERSLCPICGKIMDIRLLVCDKCQRVLIESLAKLKIERGTNQ